jgi:hypothetical protein
MLTMQESDLAIMKIHLYKRKFNVHEDLSHDS